MKVLLVDDESLARQRLRRLLAELPGCEVVAEAENGQQALDACQQLRPELVLMDIRMPVMDGLTAAGRLAEQSQPPAIIFCTAYDDYAVQAFEASAVGYLLKPVSRDKLQQAVQKAQRLNQAQLAALQAPVEGDASSHLSVRSHQGVELIAVADIRYFFADQKYVSVLYRGGEALLDQSLKQLEQRFGEQFVRVHRNALVAVAAIQGLQRCDQGFRIKLADIDQGPLISRRHLPEIRALMEKL